MANNLHHSEQTLEMVGRQRESIKKIIESLFNDFFEFPTDDKTHVTSVSCKLFAQHVAEITAQDASRRASPMPLTESQIQQGMKYADPAGEDLCRWSFKEGVKFAEVEHKIKVYL